MQSGLHAVFNKRPFIDEATVGNKAIVHRQQYELNVKPVICVYLEVVDDKFIRNRFILVNNGIDK